MELVIHITNITLNRYCHFYGIEQQNQRISNEGCYVETTNFIFNNVLVISRKYVEYASSFFLSLSFSLPLLQSVISLNEMNFLYIIAPFLYLQM